MPNEPNDDADSLPTNGRTSEDKQALQDIVGYQGPRLIGPPMTIRAATDYLSQKHGVTVHTTTVRKACMRYRRRLEGRRSEADPISPQAIKSADQAPRVHELKCMWVYARRDAGLQPRIYLIDGDPSNLDRPDTLNEPTGEVEAIPAGVSRFTRAVRRQRVGLPRGRKIGSTGGRPKKSPTP